MIRRSRRLARWLGPVSLALIAWTGVAAQADGRTRRTAPRQEIWYHSGYPGGVVGPDSGMSARMGPTKMPQVFAALLRNKLVPAAQLHTDGVPGARPAAPPIDLPSLRAVHSDAYLAAVLTGKPKALATSQGLEQWSADSARGWLLNTGGLYAAATLALQKNTITANLGHGYHHAGPTRGQGFCTINGLAVVAQKLVREGRAQRVMIIDLDQHEGNGTAACTLGRQAICNVSIYGSPMGGPGAAPNNHVVQVEHRRLGAGRARDVNYLAAVATSLPELVRQQNPDLILYQAGMDPHDCSGVTPSALAARDAFVFSLARSLNKPLTWVLAGGYSDMNTLVRLHTNTIKIANHVLARVGPGDELRLTQKRPYQWSTRPGVSTFPDWGGLAARQGGIKMLPKPQLDSAGVRAIVQQREQTLRQQSRPTSQLDAAYQALLGSSPR